jgi:integrase
MLEAAEWTEFCFDEKKWTVPFRKLKMSTERTQAGKSQADLIVPLSEQAIKLLHELQKITGHTPYLLPTRSKEGEIVPMCEGTLNDALHNLGYKGLHCAHGFRSSASTLLNRERVNGRRRFEMALVEMQQDRLDASTRAIYDRDDRLPERIELMQFWADKVDTMRKSADVLPLAA